MGARMLLACLPPVGLAVLLALYPAALIPLFTTLPFLIGGPGAVMASLGWLAGLPAPERGPEDDAGRLCEAASFFVEHWKALQIRREESVALFRASCLRVLPSLDPELRSDLERRLQAQVLLKAIAPPPAEPPNAYVEDFRTCSAGYGRMAEDDLFDSAGAIYRKIGVLPLKARRVKPLEVREAFERAEVVTFDGRSLIPARMFNTTLKELSALHPAPPVEVPTSSDGKHGLESMDCKVLLKGLQDAISGAGPGSLLEWLARRGWTDAHVAWNCQEFWTLKDFASRNLERSDFNISFSWAELALATSSYIPRVLQGRGIMSSNINVLRLPNWTRGDLDVPGALAQLGLEGLVEYTHNFLWFGATAGGLHSDLQDNVLVQLSGESELLLFPANCSFAPHFGLGVSGKLNGDTTPDFLKSLGPDAPYFAIRLRPGDAVAIPSHTGHAVSTPDPGRIGMNFFFEPAHGKMRWPAAPANFYNFAGKGHLALRVLWIRTIADMWSTRAPGSPSFIVHGERQEIV